MNIFLITLAFFLIVALAMAVGYIFQQKAISGSCGGLGSIGIDKACDCPDPCDKRKAKMAKESAEQAVDLERAEKEKEWQNNRIV